MLAVVSDAVPSTSASAGRLNAAELAVLRLLQGAARTPEELVASAVECLLLGLLSKKTLADLCQTLGLSGDRLKALLGHAGQLSQRQRRPPLPPPQPVPDSYDFVCSMRLR